MKKLFVLLIAVCLLLTLCACGKTAEDAPTQPSKPSASTGYQEEFVKPSDYAVVLSMKINPRFNLYLNENNHVLSVQAANQDAETVKQHLETTSSDLETVVSGILNASKESGFISSHATVTYEIAEVSSAEVDADAVLNHAIAVTESAAETLGLTVAVNADGPTGTSQSSQTTGSTTNTSATTNTTGTTHRHTYNSATCTEPAKCACGAVTGKALGHTWQAATCKAPKTCSRCHLTEGGKAAHTYQNGACTVCGASNLLNPKTNLKIGEEYVSKVYTPEFETDITAPGVCFYDDGGYGEGVYCLLLNATFTCDESLCADIIASGRKPITYGGKPYYRCGAGMTPAYVTLTDTEMIINADKGTVKLILTGDGNLQVTSSELNSYAVGMVMSISWNGLS